VATALAVVAPVGAATRTWTGASCGSFAGNCNWASGDGDYNNWNLPQGHDSFSLPINGDSLAFGGVYGLRARHDIVALTSVAGISFLEAAGPFVLLGRTLNNAGPISNASNQLQTISLDLNVGSSQTWDGGTGGLLVTGTVALGTSALSLVNHARIANATLPFTLNGTLSLTSGSSLQSASAALGTVVDKHALLTVTGAGSSWVNTGLVSLGSPDALTASALVQVLDGAQVTSGDLSIVNHKYGASIEQRVRVSGAGSSWTAQNLTLRGSGAELRVEAGGRFSSVNTVFGDFRSGQAKATVTGSGSSWVNSGLLTVGHLQYSTVDVLAGGSLNTAQTLVGGPGAGGQVTVDGSGSTWNASGLTGIGTGPASGTVIVRNGGQTHFTGLTLGNPDAASRSTLTVSGAGSLVRNTGTLAIDLGTLQVDTGGTVSAGVLQVGAQGVVNLNGGTLSFDSFANEGSFNWAAGTLLFDREVNLRAEPLLGAITMLGTGRTLQARTLTPDSDSILKLAGGSARFETLLHTGLAVVGPSSTLALTGGTPLAVPSELEPVEAALDNQGLVQLTGGTLSAAGAIVNREVLSGWGRIAGGGGLTNTGLIAVTGGDLDLSNTGYVHNTGTWAMLAGRSLTLSGGLFFNEGAMSLAGGTIAASGNGRLVNRPLATLTGHGEISAPFSNAGRLVVDGGTLNISQSFTSSGEVLLSTSASTLSGGPLTNRGRISGQGRIDNPITNFGTVSAQGAGTTLTLAGDVHNQGTLEVDPGATLQLPGGLGENHGVILLAGGSFDGGAAGGINVTRGVISGHGSLRVGTLLNEGHMLLGGGASELHADLTNGAGDFETAAGQIVLSGDTTFHGTARFEAGSELRVAGGTVATFLGAVQQHTGALFTGSGSKRFEGDFSVGASPGLGVDEGDVAFGAASTYLAEIGGNLACTLACGESSALQDGSFDKYIVGGQLALGGTLKLVSWNGFVAQAGQRFDLLDWGSLSGSFSQIDSSGLQLAAGTELNFSQLYTLGTVSVTAVPEPGTLALWLSGLGLAAGASARRRAARALG